MLLVLLLVLIALLLLAAAPATGPASRGEARGWVAAGRHARAMTAGTGPLAAAEAQDSGPDAVHAGTASRPFDDPSCIPLSGLALSFAPSEVYTATEVLFTAEAISGSLPITYGWSFGDGTSPITGTSLASVLTTTHTFTAAGAYTAAFSARNSCTATPAQQAVLVPVSACQAVTGTAIAHLPVLPRVGQTVVFTAATTGALPPAEFDWSFGDGAQAAGMVVSHTYTSPSTYVVGMAAANLCSQQAVTTALSVLPPAKAYLPLAVRQFVIPAVDASGMGYGACIAASAHVSYLADMGFDWAMAFVRWVDTGAGPDYNWDSVDWQLLDLVPRVHHVLLRVHHPTPAGIGDPPVSAEDLAAFRSLTQALAAHVAATWRPLGLETIAYEIWNEPNLSTEWGIPETQPSAAQYTALLRAGYQGIKVGDREAIVVSAGLATTGGSLYDTAAERASVVQWAQWFYGAEAAVPDLTFLRNMYVYGAKGNFDALGSHPYGGPDAPETAPSDATGPIYFRRVEEQRQVMLSYGDSSAIWATELGWIVETACDLGPFEWMEVSEAEQAQYLVGAYAYAGQHWPWMGPMFIFNLDFGTVFYYPFCEQMRYYSILYREYPDSGPILTRQAFSSLRDMPKEPAW